MSIKSLILFGSRARNDNTIKSDIDILAIHTQNYYKMIAYNKHNIVYYNSELLEERTKTGNLFCLHIYKEGKIIYDTNNVFKNIIEKFRYKENYQNEIIEASDLGWLLLKYKDKFDNYFYYNKKLAWCIRTILIAQSAEKRTPVFSTNDLVNFSNDEDVAKIISAKYSERYVGSNIRIMKSLLCRHAYTKPKWLKSIKTINEAKMFFTPNTYAYKVISNYKQNNYM